MNENFADTLYFPAVINPKDQWNISSLEIEPLLETAHLVTTEAVVMEFLNFLAKYPASLKRAAVNLTHDLWMGESVEVIPHTPEIFFDGLRLYESRLDKGYSLTDCISMNTMRTRAITKVLSHDNHFTQEGFTVLL